MAKTAMASNTVVASCILGLGVAYLWFADDPTPHLQNAMPESTKVAVSATPKIAPMDESAISPMTKAGYPKTFAKWGPKGIARIEEVRRSAANLIRRNASCDQLDIVEFSDNRSIPPNKIVVFADCANGQRFYVDETEAKSNSNLVTEQQRGTRFGDDAVERCSDGVAQRVQVPASLDRSLWSTSKRQAQTGNWVVEFAFTAKNAYGLLLPARARCIITTNGSLEVTIPD